MYQFRWVEQIENSVGCFIEKYKKLPLQDQILDALLVLAVGLTLLFLMLEHVVHVSEHTIHLLHRIDMVLAVIFFTDLIRTFQKSLHWTHFVRYHWLDVLAIVIVLVAFSSVIYPAAGRLSYMLRAQKLHKVTKFYHLKHATQVTA